MPPANAFSIIRRYFIFRLVELLLSLLLYLSAERNRYSASKPRNRPSGSDLNQPRFPLKIKGGLNENNIAANIPAVVLPLTIVLTSAKITIVVKEPIITGSIIVKSNRDIPLLRPNIPYRKAVTICKPD